MQGFPCKVSVAMNEVELSERMTEMDCGYPSFLLSL